MKFYQKNKPALITIIVFLILCSIGLVIYVSNPSSRLLTPWLLNYDQNIPLSPKSSNTETVKETIPINKKIKQEITMHQGESLKVPNTELTIRVKEIVDLTSRGCLGGPIGCSDKVNLDITYRGDTQNVTLFIQPSDSSLDPQRNQTKIFGYIITLISLHDVTCTLNIE